MKLTCIEVEPGRVALRPAQPRRAWMDATPGSMAYHCTPLQMASSHGWEMLCPVAFEAVWDGGQGVDAVRLTFADGETPPPHFVESHFGSGILTFNPMVILRTEREHNVWLSGPPNAFKDGVAAMSAVIEADWLPFTFSMSWKLTRPGARVRFERDEPFCFFFPVPRGIVDGTEPVLTALAREPELSRHYWRRRFQRNLAGMLRSEEAGRGWYTRGRYPDGGAGPESHQTRVMARPFRRE